MQLTLHIDERMNDSVFTDFILCVNGCPVTYMRTVEDYCGERIVLEEIETRPEFRGYGYARNALNMLAHVYQVEKVSHFGGFTRQGAERVAHHLKRMTPGDPVVEFPEFTESNPAVYVSDWTRFQLSEPVSVAEALSDEEDRGSTSFLFILS